MKFYFIILSLIIVFLVPGQITETAHSTDTLKVKDIRVNINSNQLKGPPPAFSKRFSRRKVFDAPKEDFTFALVPSPEKDSLVLHMGLKMNEYTFVPELDSLVAFFNKDAIMYQVLEKSLAKNDMENIGVNGFFIGVRSKFDETLKNFLTNVTDESYFSFVNYRFDVFDETYFLLFRYWSPTNGFNYIDFQLCEYEGKLYIDDYYNYVASQKFSEVLSLPLSQFYLSQKNSEEEVDELIEDSNKIQQAITERNNGNFQQAIQHLDSLKGTLKDTKNTYILKAFIAKNISEEAYLEALDTIEKKFSDDPKLGVILLDYYLLQDNYPEAFRYLDIIQNETGDDFLNYIRAGLYFEYGQMAEAQELYQYIMEAYPYFPFGYYSYIDTLIFEEKYKEVIPVLDKMLENKFDKDFLINLLEMEDENGKKFPHITALKAYKKWKKKKP